MSKRDELRKLNKEARDGLDKSLEGLSGAVGYVPYLHEKKLELEADDELLRDASEDWIDEVYPTIIKPIQRDRAFIAGLAANTGQVLDVLRDFSPSTSGTSSILTYLSYPMILDEVSPSGPALPASRYYKDVVVHKVRRTELPQKLDQLHAGLGAMFSRVHDNVDKAKHDIMTAKQAISDMRDVLNQLWANLAERADKAFPAEWKGRSHKFSSEELHVLAAGCLVQDQELRAEFAAHLTSAYQLYRQMSQTAVGKNPLYGDQASLDDFYVRWVQVIDTIIKMLRL